MKAFHILHQLNSHVLKLAPPTTLNFVPRLTEVMTSCHIIPRLITPYHTLSSMFDRKLTSGTTLNLVSNLLKKLSHLVTSYHDF